MKIIAMVLLACMAVVSAYALPLSSDARFSNVLSKPRQTTPNQPRVVFNLVNQTRKVYNAANWTATLIGSGTITWGGDSDGGQWFTATTTAGGTDRAFTQVNFPGAAGEKWIISFTVDSKTGTLAGNNVALNVCAAASSTVDNPALGRNALVVTLTAGGSCQFRIGNGVANANANASTIRISNVQLEKIVGSRGYPYEYVTPGDQRAFNYTYTASLSGGTSGLVQNVVEGSRYRVHPSHSILVVGNSLCNDDNILAIGGDYPEHTRRLMNLTGIREYAISERCVAGSNLTQDIAALAAAFAETDYSPGVLPWTTIVFTSGVNDIIANKTTAEMKALAVSAIQAARARNARVVFTTAGPYNAASGPQQTVMNEYNTFIKAIGVPVLDLNQMCNSGSNTFASYCTSGDGLHPGQSFNGGSERWGKGFLDMLPLLP